EALDDRRGRDLVLADGGVERIEVGQVHRVGHLLQGARAEELVERQPVAPGRPGQLLPPVLYGVLTALPGEPLSDLVAGPGGGDDLEPVARRTGRRRLRCEYLDG